MSKLMSFRVVGMDCAEETAALQKTVGVLEGVNDIRFDLIHGKMSVETDNDTSEEAIIEAVRKAGLTAGPWIQGQAEQKSFWDAHSRVIMMAFSAVFLLTGFLVHALMHHSVLDALTGGDGVAGHTMPVSSVIFYFIATILGGWHVFPKAIIAIRTHRADMNLLMTVAIIGAIAIGEWFEAAAVACLFSFSLVLESWSVGRARRAVSALMDLSPTTARYICPADGDIMEKSAEDVPIGATVLVRPGEKIPLDGFITKGETTINQAPITGESLPVPKDEGDEVFAGTINEEGAFEFKSTKPANDTTLARIINMVEEAQSRRARSEQWVEKFARYYTPIMIILALAVAVLPPLFVGNWIQWLYQALVMLVIACPCALVISTPVSIVAGLASAARAGVLIKGGVFLEMPSKLRALAIDKTGTLTYGLPEVQAVQPCNGHTVEEVLSRAASLESESGHPIAQAILREATRKGVKAKLVEGLRDIQGKGTEAMIEGEAYWIGSHRFMHEKSAETDDIHEMALRIEDQAHTLVALGAADHVCGLISVSDKVRAEASSAIEGLKRMGVEHIVMLSGDNQTTARAVAESTGVTECRAELLPEDKVKAVESLVAKYTNVAMVGDGVNDAPAMAVATVAIAMGAAGTDAAIETADIALMSDDLSRIPWLIQHSKRTSRTIKQNICFALGLKVLFMVLAVSGVATLWMAIAADMGASVIVIFNGLRLLRPGRMAA